MIESERLLLRPVTLEDIDDIYEYAQDEETGPRAGWPPHKTKEDTKKIIEMWLNPDHIAKEFAIVFKPDNKVVGTVGLQNLNLHIKESKNEYVNNMLRQGKKLIEIGITISKEYWGKGIATEVLNILKEYIYVDCNADAIITCHYEANIGSKRIQEKNNLEVVYSFERDKKWYNTDCTTMVVRAETKEKWLERQACEEKE